MKIVKPSVDILKGLSTGVQVYVSGPHLIQKWLNESRLPPSFMLKSGSCFSFAPHALACRGNLWRDLKILVSLRTAVLQLPLQSYANRIVQSFLCSFLEIGVIQRPMRTGIHPVLIKNPAKDFCLRGSRSCRSSLSCSDKWLVGPCRTSNRSTSVFIRLGKN
jgi:hypothetical protein